MKEDQTRSTGETNMVPVFEKENTRKKGGGGGTFIKERY